MFKKIQAMEERYEELNQLLAQPEVWSDQERYAKLAKDQAGLTETVKAYREYKKALEEREQAEVLLEDDLEPDFRQMVEEEYETWRGRVEELEQKLKVLLLPRDPNDEKNVIVEIRAGTGGGEAALFAGDLFRMYGRYAEEQGWKVDILDSHPTDIGGFKEIVFSVEGRGAFSRLKFESGVHRVQRIPVTEAGGRIHTSTATVAVLPEAEEVDVEIDPNDLRIDIFCSSGPGGQSVNTTQSAVRVTHLPTGLVVSCQDEKSQHRNKDKALRVLRARILDLAQQEQQGALADARRSQVGTGDRSERIRTYNFPQNRVTDHRIGLNIHRLEAFLQGDLEDMIQGLIAQDQVEKLQQVESS